MLTKLAERLNMDSNKEFEDKILTESINVNEAIITEASDADVEKLKTALEYTDVDNTQPPEMIAESIAKVAEDPTTAIHEAVVNTNSTLTVDKETYDKVIDAISIYKKESAEPAEKKAAIKTIKKFVSTVNSNMRKVSDDKPADAMVTAAINKLVTATDANVDTTKDVTKKYQLALKVNAVAKALK